MTESRFEAIKLTYDESYASTVFRCCQQGSQHRNVSRADWLVSRYIPHCGDPSTSAVVPQDLQLRIKLRKFLLRKMFKFKFVTLQSPMSCPSSRALDCRAVVEDGSTIYVVLSSDRTHINLFLSRSDCAYALSPSRATLTCPEKRRTPYSPPARCSDDYNRILYPGALPAV